MSNVHWTVCLCTGYKGPQWYIWHLLPLHKYFLLQILQLTQSGIERILPNCSEKLEIWNWSMLAFPWNLKNVKLINACNSGKDFLRNFPRIPIQTSYNGFSQKRYKMHTGRATHRDEKFQQIPWISIFLSLSVWWSRTIIDTETFERFPLFCGFQSKLCKSLGVKYTSNTS